MFDRIRSHLIIIIIVVYSIDIVIIRAKKKQNRQQKSNCKHVLIKFLPIGALCHIWNTL